MSKILAFASVCAFLLAGCAATPQTVDDIADDVASLGDLEFPVSLSATECYAFQDIPIGDVGWADRFLPPGYHSADGSATWGLPVNLHFGAAGMMLIGCSETDDQDAWWLAATHVFIDAPAIDGIRPVQPTSTPSPFTATDGGFNFYAVEFYSEGAVFEMLRDLGWNIQEMTLEVTLPDRVDVPMTGSQPCPYGRTPTTLSTPGTCDVYFADELEAGWSLQDEDGEFARHWIELGGIWNHRSFEFMYFHDTDTGTGVVDTPVADDHLLVGSAFCEVREGSVMHEISHNMPYHGQTQTHHKGGDCPDSALGALHLDVDLQRADLWFLPGVFAQ